MRVFRLMVRFWQWLVQPEPTDCPACLEFRKTDPHAMCNDCWIDSRW